MDRGLSVFGCVSGRFLSLKVGVFDCIRLRVVLFFSLKRKLVDIMGVILRKYMGVSDCSCYNWFILELRWYGGKFCREFDLLVEVLVLVYDFVRM